MDASFLDVSLPSTKHSSSKNLPKTLERNIFTNSAKSSKGGNPMLCATNADLGDNDNSLIEDSLLDLISDFPRPPTLNRCQSASTLMFASFSPHLIDRPLTPDFFTDSPSVGSYFPSFSSKHLDPDSLNLGNLSHFDTSTHSLSGPSGSIGHLASTSNIRGVNPPSPILPSFINSPGVGTPRSINVRLAVSPVQESECMDIMIPNTDLSVVSQLPSSDDHRKTVKLSQVSFAASKSAFDSLDQNYSPEIQTAISCIPVSEDTSQNSCLVEESPFPVNVKHFKN
ncbi:unnamed protein product [Lymnaea stagnalis]|uniref:Uncharacterized protein n=1 Tax=Lymnaea stagnalis TaxID=6523 RepID=A0AAV2HCC6_LYMST